MGNSTTCENASVAAYYLLLPLFIIALLTLFMVHEYRWGTSRIRNTYQPITVPFEGERKHVTLSSLSTKKRRMMVKDEKEEAMEKVENEKETHGDGKNVDVTFPDINKPVATIPTRITLVDESGTSSTFPIPSADTTFHDLLSLYASTHHLTLDHLMLLHNNMIISLESTPTSHGLHDTDIVHIIPHYKNIFEYKRTTWNTTKNQLETKISKLRADLMIVEDMAQQRASQLTDLQSRYDAIFKELSHLKSTSHMSGQHSPILESMNGDVDMWKEKVATLEQELIDALKWKAQCKTLEREAKEAQRWKSVVKQGRLREKSLEKDVKEMHHWRQRARAFEKEVKELRLFKRHVMSRYGIDETRISQDISRTGKDTTPPRTASMISSDMTLRMTPTPPLSARTIPPNMTPLNVHAIQQQQQQQQQQQHIIQHPSLHTRILQQQYPNLLHHFPTVVPNHTSSQSVPVTARGIPSTSTSTSTQNLPSSPPISQSIIGTQHSRRLTIGSSTTHIPASVTWTPSLSTPLFDLSDSTSSSTVTSPQLDAHPSHMDIHDDTDYISGLVLDDDGYNSETEQLPLNLSSDDGSENERTGEEEA